MDYSDQSKLLTCPRSYEHSRIEKLAPATERSNLSFGHAWHAILHQYATRPREMMNVSTLLQEMRWEDRADDYRTAEKLMLGFERWLQRGYGYRYMMAETSYANPLLDGMEPQEGIIDALIRCAETEGGKLELWLVDYKTTSRLQADWGEFYRNSNQFRYYYMQAKQHYPELAGVIVDLYHATKGTKSGKTQEEREGNRFHQLFIRYEDFQLQEAIRDFGLAVVTKQVYLDAGYFPKNTAACHQYGSTCPFLELCDAPSEGHRELFRKHYAANTFDVRTAGGASRSI